MGSWWLGPGPADTSGRGVGPADAWTSVASHKGQKRTLRNGENAQCGAAPAAYIRKKKLSSISGEARPSPLRVPLRVRLSVSLPCACVYLHVCTAKYSPIRANPSVRA